MSSTEAKTCGLALLAVLASCWHDWDRPWAAVDAGVDRPADGPADTLTDTPVAAEAAGPPPRWIQLPPGEFAMGSPADEPCRQVSETRHRVQLTRSFGLMSTEVTQAEFAAQLGYHPSLRCDSPACPVEAITWHQAAAFCNALSAAQGLAVCYDCQQTETDTSCAVAEAYLGRGIYNCPGIRLPTEAEWEYAYRAGSTSALYTGELPGEDCQGQAESVNGIAWYSANSGSASHEGAGRLPNSWGLYDMAGNVSEWCHDGYVKDLGAADVLDPLPLDSGELRVVRGGSFNSQPGQLRAAARSFLFESIRLTTGVRCAYGWPVTRQLVLNRLLIPTEEQPYLHDYGQGPVNQLGALFVLLDATPLDMQEEFDRDMQKQQELLLELYSPAPGASDRLLQLHVGWDVDNNWRDNFTGYEVFAIRGSSPAGSRLTARVLSEGRLESGPGSIMFPLPLLGQMLIHLEQARISGTLTKYGMEGMLTAVVPAADMETILYQVAIRFTEMIQPSYPMPEEQKAFLRDLDGDFSGDISLEELKASAMIDILIPDVDLDGDGDSDGFSVGLGLFTTTCRIDRTLEY